MEYELKVNQDAVNVDVETLEDGNLRVSVCGKTGEGAENFSDKNMYEIGYDMISDHHILMRVNADGRAAQVNAYVSDSPDGKNIVINGRHYLVCDIEAQRRKSGNRNTPDTPDLITPPTPAVVVKIHVKSGEHVKKGQKVIVVSAMKMETTLCAPYDGMVLKINTEVNDRVAPGQVLVEIEKNGESDNGDGRE